jgi:hypothetical protein
VLIFVFAGISGGRRRPILAEFHVVPNVQSVENPAVIANDVRAPAEVPTPASQPDSKRASVASVEIGGPQGPEPTRFGDWERNGRCVDF